MATQSTLRNTGPSSPTRFPPSSKAPLVGFISPQAKAIFRYTQMADTPLTDTPKICTNGLFDQNDNPNSSTYFNRVRKQSAGRTPFTIFDEMQPSLSNDGTLPNWDEELENTPKISNNGQIRDQNGKSKSISTSYRRKLDFPKTKAKKKETTPPPASVHPMALRRPRKNQN